MEWDIGAPFPDVPQEETAALGHTVAAYPCTIGKEILALVYQGFSDDVTSTQDHVHAGKVSRSDRRIGGECVELRWDEEDIGDFFVLDCI